MKHLIIGDIHGCYREFMDLLDRAALGMEDRIIALGDILDRGPDSVIVSDFFRTQSNARSLMGNHEQKHLLSFDGVIPPSLSQKITRQQMPSRDYAELMTQLRTFPLYMELAPALLIHGAFEPGLPVDMQRRSVLLGYRKAERYLRRQYPKPWYELYDGKVPLIAAHHDYSGTGQVKVVNEHVVLIDTGCCYGKALSAVLLPDFSILQVKSRRNYWGVIKQQYLHPKASK
jgi:serine/threonine protein phosphatase 1